MYQRKPRIESANNIALSYLQGILGGIQEKIGQPDPNLNSDECIEQPEKLADHQALHRNGEVASSDRVAVNHGAVRLGGRVWLLPKWYIHYFNYGGDLAKEYSELAAVLGRARLYRAASVRGDIPEDEHTIRWSVWKGLPGNLIFGRCGAVPVQYQEQNGGSEKDSRSQPEHRQRIPVYDVIQHASHWPPDIDTMSPSTWRKKVNRRTRCHRSLKDVRSLKRRFGTALGVQLVDAGSNSILGCVTVHTNSRRSLTASEVDTALQTIIANAPELAAEIADTLRLRQR